MGLGCLATQLDQGQGWVERIETLKEASTVVHDVSVAINIGTNT